MGTCRSRRRRLSRRSGWGKSNPSPLLRRGEGYEGLAACCLAGVGRGEGARAASALASRFHREGLGNGDRAGNAPFPTQSLSSPALFPYLGRMNAQSPIVSEFATTEEQAAYEKWLKEKVAASLADGQPPVAHDEVMGEIQAIIDRAKQRSQGC